MSFVFFFFSSRRRHTRFDCDWSSDVCSSDLWSPRNYSVPEEFLGLQVEARETKESIEIGRASCREKSVDLGGRRIIKKKKTGKRHYFDHLQSRRNCVTRADGCFRLAYPVPSLEEF